MSPTPERSPTWLVRRGGGRVQRNEVLFAVAERATSIYVVVSGTFRVFTSSMQGTEPTLALIHEGEIVGELGVLDDVPRSASIAALRRSEIVEVPAAFRTAYHSDPAIARQMVTCSPLG